MSLTVDLSQDLWSLIFQNVAKDKSNPDTLQTLGNIARTSKLFRTCVEKDSVWRAFVSTDSISFAAIDKERLLRDRSLQVPVRLQIKELLFQADSVAKLIDGGSKKRTRETYPLQDVSKWVFCVNATEGDSLKRSIKVSNVLNKCSKKKDVPVLEVVAKELAHIYKKQFIIYQNMGGFRCGKVEKDVSIKNFQQNLQFCLLEYVLPLEPLLSENAKELEHFFNILGADHQVLELFLLAINPYFFTNPLLLAVPEKYKHLPGMCIDLKEINTEGRNFIAHCSALFKPEAPSLTAMQLAKVPMYLMRKYAFYPNPKRVYELKKKYIC